MERSTLLEYFRLNSRAFRIEQTKSRGVPDLVRKISIRLDLLVIPTNVSAADLCERQSGCVYAELIEHVDRIHSVHLRLRHALALAVEDCSRDENVGKRLLADKLRSHHHHARHPEEDDVASRDQDRSRIKSFQIAGFVGPTESG